MTNFPSVLHEAGLDEHEAVNLNEGDLCVEFWGGSIGYSVLEGPYFPKWGIEALLKLSGRTFHGLALVRNGRLDSLPNQ